MSNKRPRDDVPPDTPLQHTDVSKLESQLIEPIAEHLGKKWDDGSIQLARHFQGGWEVWLQIELASTLIKKLSYQVQEGDNAYTVLREIPVWNKSNTGKGKGICDLWIEPNRGPDGRHPAGRPAVVVELKVDYAYLTGQIKRDGTYEEKIKFVRQRFEEDLTKMASGLTPEAQAQVEECGIRKLCIAVTSHEEDLKGWQAVQKKLKTRVNYIWLRERNSSDGKKDSKGGLAMIWWEEGAPASEEPTAKQPRAKL